MMELKFPFKKTTTRPPPEGSKRKFGRAEGESESHFWWAPKPDYFLALDIGTETIKALIFKVERQKIQILGSSLQYFDQFGVFDSLNFETQIKKRTISKAIEEARGKIKFEKIPILLGLPANLLRGKIISQSFQRERNSKIEEKEEKEIYQKIINQAKKEISKAFQIESGLLPEDLKFQSLEILEIKIDGYKVERISGFKGKNLKFKILATFLPKYDFEKIGKIIKDFNPKLLKVIHLAENLSHLLKEKKEGVFLDIGGDLTQVLIAKEGNIDQIFEFEIGGRFFSKVLSERLGLIEREARDLKERYSKGELSEDLRKKIREIILPELKNRFLNFKNQLKERSIFILPSDIFLFGGGSQIPEFHEIFEEERDLFISPTKIELILPKVLKDVEDETKTLKSPQNIPSLLLCYYAQKI